MTRRRALFWLGSGLLGALAGFALGQLTIGDGLYRKLSGSHGTTSFADYSSNPMAIAVDRLPATAPCRNCAESYAAAAHARAARLAAEHQDAYVPIDPIEITYPPLVDAPPEGANLPGLAAAGAEAARVQTGRSIAPDGAAAPGAARAVTVRQVDDSKLVTIAPPAPRAVPIALPPAQ